MTRPRDRRLPSTLTEEECRLVTQPTELPPQPWRYTITPNLVDSLIRIADAAGQMTAAPLSYYRRKELEAQAKRMRIIWVVGGSYRSVKPEEVEAVLGGPRLVEKRAPIAEAIRRAAIVDGGASVCRASSTGKPWCVLVREGVAGGAGLPPPARGRLKRCAGVTRP